MSQKSSKLFTPGPVSLTKDSLKALSQQGLHQNSLEFKKLFCRYLNNLKVIFQTKQAVFSLTCTGTGAMEAAITNCFSVGDPVLVVNAGKFGQRWTQIAQRYQLKPTQIVKPWGESVCIDDFKSHFKDKDPCFYKALFITALETSTGASHPIKDISDWFSKNAPETLFVVDAISCLGAIPLPMDELGIDILISGSQKALEGPTGLSFISLSTKAWKYTLTSELPKYYFDLQTEKKANEKGRTSFSAPSQLISAMNTSLESILEQGLEAHYKKISTRAQLIRQIMAILNVNLFSKCPMEAMSCFYFPDLNTQKLKEHLSSHYQFEVMFGQEELSQNLLRIGHMGDLTETDVLNFIQSLLNSLIELNWINKNDSKIKAANEFLNLKKN